MWFELALIAAVMTSVLPVVNKRLLVDAPVSLVAWGVNFFSLPLLGAAAFLLLPTPSVDPVFWVGIAASALLNLAATVLSTQALKWADASLVTPLLTFNPAFTLLIAAATLGEQPGAWGSLGVAFIVVGAWVLAYSEGGGWRGVIGTMATPAVVFAVGASFVWGLTPIAEKIAMHHSDPVNPPAVAFGSTVLMTALLIPSLLRPGLGVGTALRDHWRGFGAAAIIAGIAPIFGFTAIATGLVGYVSAIFKLSTVFTVVWASLFLGERRMRGRLGGSALMVLGAVLIAL